MNITAIIPAAGSGSRYSTVKNKLTENLSGVPVIIRTLQKISAADKINNIIICTSIDLLDEIKKLAEEHNISKAKDIVLGGKTRQESVFLGLKEAEKYNPDYVLIHDGARPLVSGEIIENSINAAVKKGAAIAAVPAKDTIKKVNPDTGEIVKTLNRSELWNVQTPQVFKFRAVLGAHESLKNSDFTDDAALLEEMKIPVFVVEGSYKNIKITTEEDLKIAKTLIE